SVPPTLISKSSRGSSIEVVTATCAAKLYTSVADCTAPCTSLASRTSPTVIFSRSESPAACRNQLTLCCTPRRDKLSKMCTLASVVFSSRYAQFEPTNPAPPKITTERNGTTLFTEPHLPEKCGSGLNVMPPNRTRSAAPSRPPHDRSFPVTSANPAAPVFPD